MIAIHLSIRAAKHKSDGESLLTEGHCYLGHLPTSEVSDMN